MSLNDSLRLSGLLLLLLLPGRLWGRCVTSTSRCSTGLQSELNDLLTHIQCANTRQNVRRQLWTLFQTLPSSRLFIIYEADSAAGTPSAFPSLHWRRESAPPVIFVELDSDLSTGCVSYTRCYEVDAASVTYILNFFLFLDFS